MSDDAISTLGMVALLGLITLALAISLQLPARRKARERARLYDLLQAAQNKGETIPTELVAVLTAHHEPDPDRDVRTAGMLIAIAISLVAIGGCVAGAVALAGENWGPTAGLVIAGLGAMPGAVGGALMVFARSKLKRSR